MASVDDSTKGMYESKCFCNITFFIPLGLKYKDRILITHDVVTAHDWL